MQRLQALQRAFWLAIGLFTLVGCLSSGKQVPLSASKLKKLQSRPLSKTAFIQRVTALDKQIRKDLPRRPISLPFDLTMGMPIVKAKGPGGKDMPLIMDTGAARTIFTAGTALRHSLETVPAQEASATMQGILGKETGLVGLLSPLELAEWHMPSYPIFIRISELSRIGLPIATDILGFDLAQRYANYLTLDFPRRNLTFGFGGDFRPRSSSKYMTGPLQIRNGLPFIEMSASGHRWWCLIDSGSFNGIEIDETTAIKLGVQDQGRPVEGLVLIGVGGSLSSDKAKLRTVTLPKLHFLGQTAHQAEVDISPGIPRMGTFFLKNYRVTLDLKKRRFWLEL